MWQTDVRISISNKCQAWWGRGGGGGAPPPPPPPPPAPPPGSAIVKLNERIGISVGHLVENDQNAINVGQRLDVVHSQVCKSYSQKNLQNRHYKIYNHCLHFLTLCGYIFSLSIFAS